MRFLRPAALGAALAAAMTPPAPASAVVLTDNSAVVHRYAPGAMLHDAADESTAVYRSSQVRLVRNRPAIGSYDGLFLPGPPRYFRPRDRSYDAIVRERRRGVYGYGPDVRVRAPYYYRTRVYRRGDRPSVYYYGYCGAYR
jgi:hypothetical protein